MPRRERALNCFSQGVDSLGTKTPESLVSASGEDDRGFPQPRFNIEAFLSRTGMKPYKLGEKALGDPSFVQKLMSGASPQLRTVERLRSWMRDTQPASSSEPLGEGRPRGSGPSPQGDAPTFLSTRKAAAVLTISSRTLDRFREIGTGPPYFRLGQRIVYSREDLLEWAWSKRESPES